MKKHSELHSSPSIVRYGDHVMETATESLAIGVNVIVRNFLVTHVGEHPEAIETVVTHDGAVVFIRGPRPPADAVLVEKNGPSRASYQALREQVYRKSEYLLRARVADFLQRHVKGIQYSFGADVEDMSIVIYFEPL